MFAVFITAQLKADPSVTADTNLNVMPLNENDAELIVTIPSTSIKSGGREMQATARLKDGTLNPPVKWSIIAPPGVTEYGSISDKGVYKSPANLDKVIPIHIEAKLIAKESIKGSVALDVLPDKQDFAKCTVANVVFPIIADVYKLPTLSKELPKTWNPADKQATVCMENYNIPLKPFNGGFPGAPMNLEEDFGLNTRTTIIIPTTDKYSFKIISDDGSKMWIDDKLILNHDGLREGIDTVYSEATVDLTQGKHKLVLDYFQGPRFSIALMLFWKRPGDKDFWIVPRTAFEQ
ncbi:MAG: hypothetical protein EOP04_13260 [Proteobacteria bacterium]|nr:MAG: hypothetical protein EOP04_13260 [Pseudomonadota bacterium]